MNEHVNPDVMPAKAADDIATAVTYQLQLDAGRQFIFQTYIPRDAPLIAYQDMIAKLTGSVARLELQAMIDAVEKDIMTDEIGLDGAMENYEAVGMKNEAEWKARGKKGEPKLSATEEAAKLNFATTIKGYRTRIEAKKKGLEELRAKLAKGG